MAYDTIAPAWAATRPTLSDVEACIVEQAFSCAVPGERFLDLGCGSGEPLCDEAHQKRLVVTGVDQSRRMIEIAIRRQPLAHWVCMPIEDFLPCAPQKIVLAWDSLFHLPRALHAKLFMMIRASLCPGGRFLFTYGCESSAPFLQTVLGHPLYFDCLAPEELSALLVQTGFEVERSVLLDHPSGADKGRRAVLSMAC
jgi:SAM-dependent methyltransferase